MALDIQILDHPLADHCLAHLRDAATPPSQFRSLTRQLTTILTIEATRELRTSSEQIQTPLEKTDVKFLDEQLVVVPILRAGLGMLEPVVELFPKVSVGYMGLERDEETAEASIYYSKLPPTQGKTVLLVDPMLATGGSASHALGGIRERHPHHIILICIVAAPEGVESINRQFPEVKLVTAALDRGLNDKKYIVPGLGDFGDRLYGTT